MIHGIDVSFYEPNIDWATVKGTGLANYAFIRAGQGIVADTHFGRHREGAKSVGIPWGAYWFYDPRYRTVNPKRQAEKFVETLGGDLGELPLVIDIEAYSKGPWHGWRNWYDFMERVKTLLPGKRMMIYTGFYFWRDQGPWASDVLRHQYFAQYDLWLAFYPHHADTTMTPDRAGLVPLRGWKTWTFWQYDDKQTLDGITGEVVTRPANVDFNYFNGTAEQFENYLENYEPPVVVEPPVLLRGVVVARDGVRVREQPSKGAPTLGSAARRGATLVIDQREGNWVHVTEVDGRPRTGWMCTFDGIPLIEVYE